MLFKQNDISYDPIQEATGILNESIYLTEAETATSVKAIPVVENTRIGAWVVKFDDVTRLAEDHGLDYIDAMQSIAEANSIDFDNLAVAVCESTILTNPAIVDELNNVVITPIPETDTMYQFTEACVDAFIESGDIYFMDLLLSEASNRPKKNAKPGELGGGIKYDNDGTAFQIRQDKVGNEIKDRYLTLGGRIDMSHKTAILDKNIAKAEMQNAKGIKKLLKAVKLYGYNTPKERILAAINALQKKYQELIRELPENKKNDSFWQSILRNIDKVISKLTHLFKKKIKDKDNTFGTFGKALIPLDVERSGEDGKYSAANLNKLKKIKGVYDKLETDNPAMANIGKYYYLKSQV